MISLEDVQDMVTECLNLDDRITVEVDSAITVDSFTLVWIQHLLEEKHDLEIQPQRSDLADFTSVRAVHAYLLKNFPDSVAAE
ncbi:hypothetical protein [Streptomyces sp. I8-5]|uniref:hypothetical protein n=1 Tax=Streptomyces sp. I8-5 TaxID=3104277 RepID=UPI00386A1594